MLKNDFTGNKNCRLAASTIDMSAVARILATGLVFCLASSPGLAQQPASAPAAPATPASPASGGTFSMETEIFAYRALQSDSEAIACDIAGFLKGQRTKPDDKGSCDPTPDGTGQNLIIVSSTTTVPTNFQVWRANMAIANELLDLAKQQGCPASGEHTLSFVTTASVVMSLVQGVLALFATNQASNGVQGSIQDQALMSGVARQLRASKFNVLMPDVYGPYTFGGLDYAHSPFLAKLQNLIDQRSCMDAKLLSLLQDLQDKTQKKTMISRN